MSAKPRVESPPLSNLKGLSRFFPGLFGAFLGLSLLKFGNPPIMEKWVTPPANAYEFVLGSPWPILWAYTLLVLLSILGAAVSKRKLPIIGWPMLLPLAWFVWEFVASFWTSDGGLTSPTLAHFLACTVCFYLGFFSLAPCQRIGSFWVGILCGLVIVIAVGWEQHFGGLEQTRQYFFLYIYPRLKQVPPDYLKKIASTRIFSTLFYPNALAGAILLILPATLQIIWLLRDRFTTGARVLLISVIGLGGLACLYWSGSKGGWLLMLVLGLVWLLRLPFSVALKRSLILAILVLGLAGFFLRYAGFFERGATSVSARFDYWAAAVRTTLDHPLVGTGPGTFSIAYQKVKRPESEMSRLVHNDYLEQASDSGLPGFIFYTAFVFVVLMLAYPPLKPVEARHWPLSLGSKPRAAHFSKAVSSDRKDAGGKSEAINSLEASWLFALWLGALGWALQGLLEFGLYIPGLAWPAFAFMGFLLGRRFHKVGHWG